MATQLRAIRGDTFMASFIWSSNGDPIDLTGYDVLLSLTHDGTTTEYTVADALTVTELDGRIDVSIDEDVTAEWGCNPTYALVVTSPSDDQTTLARGLIKVS